MQKLDRTEKVRDKKYFEDKLLGLMRGNLSYHSFHRQQMAEAFQYFADPNFKDKAESLFSNFNLPGDKNKGQEPLKIPYLFSQFKVIRQKVKYLEGQLIELGFGIDVRAINENARFERAVLYRELLRQTARKKQWAAISEAAGINIGYAQGLPEDEEDLKWWIEKKYKSQEEWAIYYALKHLIRIQHYKSLRLQMIRHVFIGGECHATVRVRGGVPVIEIENPLMVVADKNPRETDQLFGASFILRAQYFSIPEIIERNPHLKKEEIEELKEAFFKNDSTGMKWTGLQFSDWGIYSPFMKAYNGGLNDSIVDKVLEVSAEWIDVETTYLKKGKDRYGNEHAHTSYGKKMTLKKGEKGTVETGERQVLYRATLVAGKYLCDWGRLPNRISRNDSPLKTELNTVSFIPHLVQGQNTSMAMEVQPLESYRNFLITKVQHEFTKLGGSATYIDVSKLDPEIYGSAEQVKQRAMYYFKGFGVVFGDSSRNLGRNVSGNDKAFGEVRGATQMVIEPLLRTILYLDKLIDDKTVSATVMGQTVKNDQLNWVTQNATAQALKIQGGMFEGFFTFESRLLQLFAEKLKICISYDPERWKPIIGMQLTRFVEDNVDVRLADYGCQVYSDPVTDKQLQALLSQAVSQNGQLLHRFLPILMDARDDVRGAVDQYIRKMEKIEAEQIERSQQMELQKEAMRVQASGQIEAMKNQAQQEKDARGLEKAQIQADGAVKASIGSAKIQADERERSKIRLLEWDKVKEQMRNRTKMYGGNSK